LEDRQRESDEEQYGAEGRSPALPVLVEPHPEEQRRRQFSGTARPALREHVHDVERLERADHAQGEQGVVRRTQVRQDHVPDELRRIGAVDACRLDEFARQTGECGLVHRHREARPQPHVHERDRDQRSTRIGQPRVVELAEADGIEGVAQVAVVGLEDLGEQESHHDRRQHDRDEEQGAQHLAQSPGSGERDREKESAAELEPDGDEPEHERVACGRQHGGTREHPDEVVEPDELGHLGQSVPVEQTDIRVAQQGVRQKDHEDDDARHYEEHRGR
jgi:hypothetical protein